MRSICGILGYHNKKDIQRMLAAFSQLRAGNVDSSISSFLSLGAFSPGEEGGNVHKENSSTKSAGLSIVFDGCIYNRQDLRNKLIKKGYDFYTRSDEELISRLFKEYGQDCVDLLKGDFVFAISAAEELFLARDKLGKRPLFYAFLPSENLFLFASEIKAILQSGKIPVEIDELGLLEHCVGEDALVSGSELTCIKGIRQLLAGTAIFAFQNRRNKKISIKCRKYFSLCSPDASDLRLNSAEAKERISAFGSLMEDTCKLYALQNNLPKAIMLSGGLDSSLIAYFFSKFSEAPLHTFFISDNKTQIDLQFARRVANYIGATHHELSLSLKDYFAELPYSIFFNERPFSYPFSMPVLFKHSLEFTPELICGEGADELFGGYLPSFAEIERLQNRVVLKKRYLAYLELCGAPTAAKMRERLNRLFPKGLDRKQQVVNALDFYCRESLTNKHLWNFDRVARRYGIEGRLPYLYDDIVEMVIRLPINLKINNRSYKYILRKLIRRCFKDKQLSSDIINRKKEAIPSCSKNVKQEAELFVRRFIKKDYYDRHPYKPYFFSYLCVLAFDLFRHVFIKNKGIMPHNFNIKEFCASEYRRGKEFWQ